MPDSLSRYFFEAIHHRTFEDTSPLALPQDIIDSQSAQSILLSANADNFPLIRQCPSFAQLIESFSICPQDELRLEHIWRIQHSLLLWPQIRLNELLPHFAQLNLAQILSDEALKILASLDKRAHSASLDSHSQPQNSESLNLKTLKKHFTQLCAQLNPLLTRSSQAPDQSLASSLEKILTKLNDKRFSIGITGVLSAGKSTFLNALLGEEILGSSNIPETANLTILRYGAQERARVHFWSDEQWQELCDYAQNDANLKAFIEQTTSIFGNDLKRFITSPKTTKDIESRELHAYTSANHPSKFCNLIQQVELFTPLVFLQNGVEIVDTPGLDDPITKREEITRDYIQHCDLLIHVMNASCAATQVDIDFILESLLERNISRLLIVLTRVDLLTPQEIQASLEYTQKSLITQLKKAHYKGDIQAIIARIDFIPLAGYTALLYRTNRIQEAQKSGISLEQSGILKIESCLNTMLLGEESLKSKDMLYLACNATLKLTHEASELIELQNSLLHASAQELEHFIAQTQEQNNALLHLADELGVRLDSLQGEFFDFLHTLSRSSHSTLSKASTIIRDKVLEDILYAYSKGLKPESKAICTMIELSLKDCFADIGREFKYELAKQITHIKQNIQDEEDLPALTPAPQVSFRLTPAQSQELLSEMLASLPSLLASHSTSSKNTLKAKLDELFEMLFKAFETFIERTTEELKERFCEYFEHIVATYKAQIQAKIEHKTQILNNALAQRQNAHTQTPQESLATTQECIREISQQLTHIVQSLNQQG